MFEAAQYGYYIVKYVAYDEYDCVTENIFKYKVLDETKPVLVIDGELETVYSVNSSVTMPRLTATDDVSQRPETYITIFTPGYKTVVLESGDPYVFKEKGSYVIVYTARDDAYNLAEKTVVVLVE